jgi:glycosyltransferase involved in cell wall biosynthesis
VRKLLRLAKIVAGGFIPSQYKAKIGRLMASNPPAITVVSPVTHKRRVLHVIANFFLGGSSRLVADIVYASSDHYQHQVVTSAAPTPAVYPDIPVHVYPMGFNPHDLTLVIEDYDPDLVHIHYWGDCDEPWYAAVYALIKDRRCRVIENINTPVAPYVGDAIDRYVYVSDYVKHNFPAETSKSLTIYPGSDFDLFKRKNLAEVPDDCIGMVYRLENDKLNLDSIQPFIETVKKRPQTKVIIVGGGSNLKAYQKACDDAGVLSSFTFTGYVDYETLPDWYRQFSIFVAPVWKESFGQVSPFAMSMGIPVVGYDIGAISEIIGTHDLLANAGDAQQLSDIITNLLDNRKQRLEIGEYNRQRAIELFSVQAMTHAYCDMYGQLLEQQV